MIAIINFLNTIFWGYVLIYGLLAVGIYFTVRLGFIQFRHFGEMIRCVTGSRGGTKNGISPLQAVLRGGVRDRGRLRRGRIGCGGRRIGGLLHRSAARLRGGGRRRGAA